MSTTTHTDKVPAKFSASFLVWLPLVLLLAIGGVILGFFLPTGRSPIAEIAATTSPELAITSAEQTTPKSTPVLQSTTIQVHEYPLSAADIRDTQEAPVVAVDAAGRICLAWASKTTDAEKALLVATSTDGGQFFSPPRTIHTSGVFKPSSGSKGKNGGFERRMIPLLASSADTLLLAWNDAPADGSSIRMLLAESHDGGQMFGEPICVHQSDAARPTFNGLAINARGQAACSWLDCRNGPQQLFAAVRPDRSSGFAEDQRVFAGPNETGVCPCCITAACVAEDGTTFIAFRNQLDGYRDTWISRRASGEEHFSESAPIVPPTWQFDGCPHDGPSLVICGGALHVTWMDAHTGRQRTYYARSKLPELKFEVQELNATGPGTQGNARLCTDARGRLHCVWEESLEEEAPPAATEGSKGHIHGPPTGAGRVIRYACSALGDGRFSPTRSIAPQPGRFQTRPGLACAPDGSVVAAWTELDESGKRVVVCRFSEPPAAAMSPATAQAGG